MIEIDVARIGLLRGAYDKGTADAYGKIALLLLERDLGSTSPLRENVLGLGFEPLEALVIGLQKSRNAWAQFPEVTKGKSSIKRHPRD
jgi:hypothetical protein